jgi:hypothetical protein
MDYFSTFFLTSVFKDNMSLRSYKTVKIMVFCLLMKQNFAIFHGNWERNCNFRPNRTTYPVCEPSTINNKIIQHLHLSPNLESFKEPGIDSCSPKSQADKGTNICMYRDKVHIGYGKRGQCSSIRPEIRIQVRLFYRHKQEGRVHAAVFK